MEMIPYERVYGRRGVDRNLLLALTETLGGIEIINRQTGQAAIATLGDLKRSPDARDFKSDRLIDAIATQLGIDPAQLRDVTSPDHVRFVLTVKLASMTAKNFLEDQMLIKLHPDAQKSKIDSFDDILHMIRQTTAYSKRDKHAGLDVLDRHASFCILVLETISAFELQSIEARSLSRDAATLESILTEPREHNAGEPLLIRSTSVNASYPVIIAPPYQGQTMRGVATSFGIRHKRTWSQMLKLSIRPTFTYKKTRDILRDEISLEVKVPPAFAPDAITAFASYFKLTLGVRGMEIANTRMLDGKQLSDLMQQLRASDLTEDAVDFELGTKQSMATDSEVVANTATSKRFSNIKLQGNVVIPDTAGRIRSFEIQFVEPNNTNNKGDGDKGIYKLRQICEWATRRFGGFSQTWLYAHIAKMNHVRYQEASKIIATETVEEMLLRNGSIRKLSRTPHRTMYAAPEAMRRQAEIPGLLPAETIELYLHALNTPRR